MNQELPDPVSETEPVLHISQSLLSGRTATPMPGQVVFFNDVFLVRLTGKLTQGSVRVLESTLREMITRGERILALDLSRIEDMDRAGVETLIGLHRLCRCEGGRLAIVPPKHPGMLHRVEQLGHEHGIMLFTDATSAVRTLQRPARRESPQPPLHYTLVRSRLERRLARGKPNPDDMLDSVLRVIWEYLDRNPHLSENEVHAMARRLDRFISDPMME
jgi:anti-anti-sigma factor